MGSFSPPAGSQDIPHPRTPLDILVRTLAIQAFTAIAYAHLLYLLQWRRPHGAGALSWLLIPAFLCIPELILLQLAFAILPVVIAAPYRRRVVSRFKSLPYELGLLAPPSRNGRRPPSAPKAAMLWLGVHATFTILNALPLAAVLGAYLQRFGMGYHGATNVANLGLDHRNGWTAVGGLVATTVTTCAIAGLAAVVAAGAAEPASARLDNDGEFSLLEAHRHASVSPPDSPALKKSLESAARSPEIDWSSLLELLYVTGVHQPLLAVIHHPVPLILIFYVWYLWPLAGLAIWYLAARRRVHFEILALGASLFIVMLTAAAPLVWDLMELYWVSHGRVEPWNFRWAFKDRVSVRHRPDI